MDIKELNLSIFSYNVYWKIMKLNDSLLNKNLNKTNLIKLKSNVLKNILNTKNYFNPFIYCFQESESFLDIINLFEKSLYKYHLGYSNPEHILTIWRKDIMKKKLVLDGEFEAGRPFSIFVFKDLRYKIYWILINIHSGHNPYTETSIFEPIQKLIQINQNKINKYDISRIIIIGDFNRDISSQIKIEPTKYKLILNSNEFNFKPTFNNNKTCCSLNGLGHKFNYDQVIDSYSEPILTYQLNNENWYLNNSSDHLAILSVLKNFIKTHIII
jgi:hypothetical protein